MASKALVWFRQDLRVEDHPALYNACEKSQSIAVYLIHPKQWQLHGESPNKLWYWMQNLIELKTSLSKLNIPLVILQAPLFKDAAKTLYALADQCDCDSIWFNEEYGVNEELRDQSVEAHFNSKGLGCHRFISSTLFKPGTVLNGKGEYFKVFTPFRKKLYQSFEPGSLNPLPSPKKQNKPEQPDFSDIDLNDLFTASAPELEQTFPAGEAFAHQQLKAFIQEKASDYKDRRDFPAIDATSSLSASLTAGTLSIRQCFHAAWQANDGEMDTGNKGLICWMSELIWREFYKHILHGFPRVSKHRAFKEETEQLPWSNDSEHLSAWQNGRTGYPLVDAAMKQLVTTGWMHNRLRMVTAMFLSKNLMLDWRLGETFFMEHLVDGDLAANNGGWQWSASTGTDAAPYFRMFNPVSQSQKFDPKGTFIRKWLPELAHLDDKEIHEPWKSASDRKGYPDPIVDHSISRERVMSAFKALS